VFILGTKHIPLLETLPENIACLAFLFVAAGCLLAAILSSQLTTWSADHAQRFPQRSAPRLLWKSPSWSVVLGDYKAF